MGAEKMTLLCGDCLELMKEIPDGSVDMVLCDLPYCTTRNLWDRGIDLDGLWGEYKRVIRPKRCIALFAQTPFAQVLGMSNLKMLKYEWIWEKTLATGHLNSHFAPLKSHENILIFSDGAASYVKNQESAMVYNPQIAEGKPYKLTTRAPSHNYDMKNLRETTTVNEGTRLPRDVVRFPQDKEHYHPTQKPVPLLEYLIRTYTNPGETVLDNCMGSGSTGVACVNTGRDFIGIELDEHYFEIAKKRIEDAREEAGM